MRYILLILLGLIAGCSSDYLDANESVAHLTKDTNSVVGTYLFPGMEKKDYSLYCDNGEKAKLVIARRKVLKFENGIKAYWQARSDSLFDRKFDPYRISQKCKRYINNDSTEKLTYKEYISSFKSKLGLAESDQIARNRRYLKLAFDNGFVEAEKINKKYCIVCLEPLVVVELEIDNFSLNRYISYRSARRDALYFRKSDGYFYRYDPLKEYRGRVVISYNMPRIASGLVLPNGLDFGLEMPYVESPRWFSPDMKVKDQPVEMISETKGRIEVPWGYLYLTRQNDNWIVTAEK
jgi:hypothetical protein